MKESVTGKEEEKSKRFWLMKEDSEYKNKVWEENTDGEWTLRANSRTDLNYSVSL